MQFSAVIVLLLVAAARAKIDANLELEQNILKTIFKGYDNNMRPSGINGTGPVNVTVNMFIRSINNFDDVSMTYDTQLTFRQSWIDERLKYDNKDISYVTVKQAKWLWIPDLFFSNERVGHFHNIFLPNTLIRVFPNGMILYSVRVSLSLFCPMDLRNYPMDSQQCSIYTASYGYTTKDVVFNWKDDAPIQVTKRLFLQKFSLEKFVTDYCTSKTNTGEYSCLNLRLLFSRNFFYYLERVYMPTAALVILSWISFWLHPRLTNIRLGICMGILISTIIVTTNANSTNPQVSYTKAIDVWLGMCVTFIFSVFLELCWVSSLQNNEEESGSQRQSSVENGEDKKTSNRRQSGRSSTFVHRWLNKYSTSAQKIDVVSRILFPAIFALFNMIYWISHSRRVDDF